ncbi:uncharacterized protein K489DRAFT_221200 [Dissoconium aciculare CBS 342.82]|uniref:Uncharacterized protein n=1 Tax=Dissoconium aciculare CBS 342.82 TaxID=1314786 RepID=A0A6J3M5Z1_9PEZI|nr:uncharacterized protein K489DRAFT_221200 [Dissoconium aciculare CBS 342.82]KAF1822949.1 hypothetical protein K489DRAFT_221200 [Dissoconium aciculare CBS 342.82]
MSHCHARDDPLLNVGGTSSVRAGARSYNTIIRLHLCMFNVPSFLRILLHIEWEDFVLYMCTCAWGANVASSLRRWRSRTGQARHYDSQTLPKSPGLLGDSCRICIFLSAGDPSPLSIVDVHVDCSLSKHTQSHEQQYQEQGRALTTPIQS